MYITRADQWGVIRAHRGRPVIARQCSTWVLAPLIDAASTRTVLKLLPVGRYFCAHTIVGSCGTGSQAEADGDVA